MKLRIEYPVLTSGVPYRTSKERLVILTDSAEFDIPDFSSAEVPEVASMVTGLAARDVIRFRGHGDHVYTKLADREEVLDGSATSYSLVLPSNGKPPEDRVWSPLNRSYAEQLSHVRYHHSSDQASKVFPPSAVEVVSGRAETARLGGIEDYRFNEIVTTPFLHARQEMFKASRDLIMVDGELWRCNIAPFIAYAPRRGGMPDHRINASTYASPVHVPLSEVGCFGSYYDFSLVFGALDVDEGFERAMDVARRISAEEVIPARPAVGIEVFDPSYFRDQDVTPIGLLHCAHKIRENLSHGLLRGRGPYDNALTAHQKIGMNVGNFSAEALLLLHSIANEIPETDRTGDYGRLASLVRQASETPEAYSPGRTEEQEFICMSANVDMWENRPITAPLAGAAFNPA